MGVVAGHAPEQQGGVGQQGGSGWGGPVIQIRCDGETVSCKNRVDAAGRPDAPVCPPRALDERAGDGRVPHLAERERESQQTPGQAADVFESGNGIRDAAIERSPRDRPVGAHRQMHAENGIRCCARRDDPLRMPPPCPGRRERPDREAVEPGQNLGVEGRARLRGTTRRIQRVVPAFAAHAVDRAFAVLRRREGAARQAQHIQQEVGNTRSDRGGAEPGVPNVWRDPASRRSSPRGPIWPDIGHRSSRRIGRQQLRVVAEHALVMRLAPIALHGVAEEAAIDRVAQRGRRKRVTQSGGEIRRVRAACARPRCQEGDHRCVRELRAAAEAAELGVFEASELGHRRVELLGGRQDRRHPAPRRKRLQHRTRRSFDLAAPLAPRLENRLEHHPERRGLPDGPRRVVGTGEERGSRGRGEHGQGPAQVAGEGTGSGEIGGVRLRMLLPVDLDGHEVVVQKRGERGVGEALAGHHVAPVARRIADRDEHRDVALCGLREGLFAPGPPAHRVARVGSKVWADSIPEPVRHKVRVCRRRP